MKITIDAGRLLLLPETLQEAFSLARLLHAGEGYDLKEYVDPTDGTPAVEVGIRQRPGPRPGRRERAEAVSTAPDAAVKPSTALPSAADALPGMQSENP